MTAHFTDPEQAVDWIIEHVGRDLRAGLPLGLGKPVTLVNALVQRACVDSTIKLQIFTALTLERPRPSGDLERRFMEPALDRLFGAYPTIEYARLLREDRLPDNISVSEFFFQAPNWLGIDAAQQNYVSANYTHALDVLLAQKPNLILQLLASDAHRLSLSCNTDISTDLLELRRSGALDFTLVGQVHADLPFMPGPAEISSDECAAILETPHKPFGLFSVVKQPVSIREHAIGLHVSRLIPDGGTLQIGIGQVGDAVANALILRQQGKTEALWERCPFFLGFQESGPFQIGLYGVTEMLVDGMLALFEQGIIRRQEQGAAIHAGFFLDSHDFYARLHAFPEEQRAQIAMMPVSFTNALYGSIGGDEAQKRSDARFVNSAMMVTLLGAVVSDGTEDGRVVSGVGGQFNFVEQAFALDGARAVITLPSTRQSNTGLQSNLRWQYGHVTVPRHMRDIVVTEYGIADLRGKSDADTVAALLEIADSRFQGELEREAKTAGKLPADYRLPEYARHNTPESLHQWLSPRGDALLPRFPFGTAFTETEQRLLPALAKLKTASHSRLALAGLMLQGWRGSPAEGEVQALRRMALDQPRGFEERLSASALRGALRETAATASPPPKQRRNSTNR